MNEWYPFSGDPMAIPRHKRGKSDDPLYPVLEFIIRTTNFKGVPTAHNNLGDLRYGIKTFGYPRLRDVDVYVLMMEHPGGVSSFTRDQRKRLHRGQRHLWGYLATLHPPAPSEVKA